MKRYRRAATIRMTELFVRTSLANFSKALSFQEVDYLSWIENRSSAHASGNLHSPNADELRFLPRLPVLKEHGDDFSKILRYFVFISALGVSSGPTWNVSHVNSGIGIHLDDKIESSHGVFALD